METADLVCKPKKIFHAFSSKQGSHHVLSIPGLLVLIEILSVTTLMMASVGLKPKIALSAKFFS